MLMAPTSSGPNLPQSTEKSWELPEQWHGSSDNETLRTEQQMVSPDHENP